MLEQSSNSPTARSIADEARAHINEERPAWHDNGVGIVQGSHYRSGFVAGAEWQASRKVEAAPSDTDEVLAVLSVLNETGGIAYDDYVQLHDAVSRTSQPVPFEHECEWECVSDIEHLQRAYDGLKAEYAEHRKDMRTRLAQPVQIEVTDEMVARAGRFMYAFWDEWEEEDIQAAGIHDHLREVLEAALGGGDQ